MPGVRFRVQAEARLEGRLVHLRAARQSSKFTYAAQCEPNSGLRNYPEAKGISVWLNESLE